jgi:hypothetical protein
MLLSWFARETWTGKQNTYTRFWYRNILLSIWLEDRGEDLRIILKLFFEECIITMRTNLNCIRIGSNGGLQYYWALRFRALISYSVPVEGTGGRPL